MKETARRRITVKSSLKTISTELPNRHARLHGLHGLAGLYDDPTLEMILCPSHGSMSSAPDFWTDIVQ